MYVKRIKYHFILPDVQYPLRVEFLFKRVVGNVTVLIFLCCFLVFLLLLLVDLITVNYFILSLAKIVTHLFLFFFSVVSLVTFSLIRNNGNLIMFCVVIITY
ncbi:hypothetical protein EDC94DRAFT_617085 [Helicostylum pulchrum]|nr:hypothetical protein EDC94DRAFT_617085 [Helicostylum pulchrum]